MVAIVVAIGFVGMVLAPTLAAYGRLGGTSEPQQDLKQKALDTESAQAAMPPVPTKLLTQREDYVRRPVSLSTSQAVPVALPSLRQVAERAAREAVQAQAEAAKAMVQALQEASRAASLRVAAAEKLAEAAERELLRASQASLQAEAAKAKEKRVQQQGNGQDYLPSDHPSLDFPRSRVPSRRVA